MVAASRILLADSFLLLFMALCNSLPFSGLLLTKRLHCLSGFDEANCHIGEDLWQGTEGSLWPTGSVKLRSSDQLPSGYMANNHVNELGNKVLLSSPVKTPEEIPALVNILTAVL